MRKPWRRWLWVLVAVLAAALYTGYLLAFRAISHSERAHKADGELQLFGHAVVGHYEGQRGELRDDPLAPTGDALTDKYAKLVYDRVQSLDTDPNLSTATPPDSLLAAWEPEFGKEPRLWELRYWCASNSSKQPGVTDPLDYLREAERRGVANANTYLVHYAAVRLARVKAASDADKAKHKPGEIRLYPPSGAAAASELKLLDAAVNAGSDEAWPYYCRAAYWYSLGDAVRGLAELQKGNAAPKLIGPSTFPHNAPITTRQVKGAVLLYYLGSGPPEIQLAGVRAGRGRLRGHAVTPDELNAWLQYSCRLPHSYEEEGLVPSLVVSVIRETQSNALKRTDLRPSERETLDRLFGATAKIIEGKSDYDLTTELIGLEVRYGPQGEYMGFADEAEASADAMDRNIYPILRDIAQLDFADLDHPPKALLKYDPLTREEVKRRNAERRKPEEAKGKQ